MTTNIASVVEILQKKIGTGRWSKDSSTSLTVSGSSVIEAYGSKEHFLELFNPSMQSRYCQDVLRCYEGKAPTLKMIGEAYGGKVAVSWLYSQICNLSEYSNNPNKITVEQATELATLFYREYDGYKVTEWMLFFYRFKLGKYESKFYQSVDPIVIANAFKEFRAAVNPELYRLYEEKEQREKEERKRREQAVKTVTLEEYKKMVENGEIT